MNNFIKAETLPLVRGTSLIRNDAPLGPYGAPMPRVLGGSNGGGGAVSYGRGTPVTSHSPLCQVPKPIASIEEGMNNFIKAETLDGNNRYQLDPDEKSGRTEKMMVAPPCQKLTSLYCGRHLPLKS